MVEYNIKQCAYIGDAVWELYIRELCVQKCKVQKAMHNFGVKYVNATFQANLLNQITEFLTDDEREIVRRGRNVKISINKKSNPQIHSLASAFEVLVGYFYLNDKKRLADFFEIVKKYLNDD